MPLPPEWALYFSDSSLFSSISNNNSSISDCPWALNQSLCWQYLVSPSQANYDTCLLSCVVIPFHIYRERGSESQSHRQFYPPTICANRLLGITYSAEPTVRDRGEKPMAPSTTCVSGQVSLRVLVSLTAKGRL